MPANLRLFTGAAGNLIIEGVRPNSDSIERIAVQYHFNGNSSFGEFKLGKPVDIPDLLLDTTTNPKTLKTWAAIQKDIKNARDQLQDAIAAAIEEARDRVRGALSNIEIDISAGGGFLGLTNTAFPFTGSVACEAVLSFDLIALNGAADAVVVNAVLTAAGQVAGTGASADAAVRFEVSLTKGEVVDFLPSVSITGLPKFPPIHLHWPKFQLPHFNWSLGLDLPDLSGLLQFHLPLPQLQALSIDWHPAPAIKLQLASGKLSIATSTAGEGDLIYLANGARQVLAAIHGIGVTLTDTGHFSMTGNIDPIAQKTIPFDATNFAGPDLLPFKIELAASSLTIEPTPAIDLATGTVAGSIALTLDLPRILIRAKSDPNLLIAFHVTYVFKTEIATGKSGGKLTRLDVVEPYPVKLIVLAAEEVVSAADAAAAAIADAAEAIYRLLSSITLPKGHHPVPPPDSPNEFAVLDRIFEMIAAAARWLAKEAGAVGNALLGVAEALGEALATLLKKLREALDGATPDGPNIEPPRLVVEVRLDSRTHALRQIVISPAFSSADTTSGRWTGEALGLGYDIGYDWLPTLVIDLDDSVSVSLLVLALQTPNTSQGFKLGTDLWLSRPSGIEAVRDTDSDGKRGAARLIEVTCRPNKKLALSLFRLSGGKPHFLEAVSIATKLTEAGIPSIQHAGQTLRFAQVSGPIRYQAVNWSDFDLEAEVQKDRLLPFLQSPGQGAPKFLDSLGQYIQVTADDVTKPNGDEFLLPLHVTLKIKDAKAKFDLNVKVRLHDLRITLESQDSVVIQGKSTDSHFDLLGLDAAILPKTYKQGDALPASYDFFKLDFSHGDVRLGLAPAARLDLSYGKVASSGRGIVFRIDDFGLSRSGLDLAAQVDPDTPVQLAGVDMPFRFDSGGITINNSTIQAFSIKGSGQLPPELVGEANVTIAISMGRGSNGSLVVQSAEAKLDKSGDPIVCHATRFTLTISALGFEFHDFANEGAGYHFYFTLTGTATFTPGSGEFTDGLLKYLGSITIALDKAPLARDASMLLRAIDFQVTVQPKKTFNIFNLFTFELRGIGFQPASPAFGGKPALSISGQVKFVEAGDVISPRFDFHKLWIAPAKSGQTLPQIRFDGLTVGIRFGGAASIEATAIAVDDSLPSLYSPGALPADVTAKGFLASGKVTIKGWGAMSAAMGFLELRKQPDGPLRQAFFLYAEDDSLSIEIPTPVGPIYLREVGFGFGYRFTIAAFNRADKVKNVQQLIKVLDEVSKYQGNLASLKSWEPEADGNRVTLALRGLISITTASGETEYNEDGEKDLANPVLFDIVAALRSDFTFFLNARVWIVRNYYDWHESSANDDWRNNPTLRGYAYLSVPRKEFLARIVADGTGDVDGTRPKLPAPLVKAMKGIRWSATTYIRPGLFHQEFGWPYELGFTFQEGGSNAQFSIDCSGGMINRIEDLSILYGIAFRAKGFAQFGGEVGGGSFGASAVARVDFSLDAKFIAYVSLQRIGDTMFYGSLAFDTTISLQVRVWLNIDASFVHIHLEVGFSLSLTISLALEAAAWVNRVGARGSASVAVGAFGRHVRLGINLSMNPGALDQARAQVQRFLQLGLTVSTPDAEQGVAPPAAELPRGPRSGDADHAVDQGLDKHDAVADQPQSQPTAKGRDLQPSGYWAMLFPVAGDDRKAEGDQRYVMIFVPRDHSETGLDETTLPTRNGDGELLGSFYAPPPDPTAALQSSLTMEFLPPLDAGTVIKLEMRAGKGVTTDLPQFGSTAVNIAYDVDRIAADAGGGKTIRLGQLLEQCFVQVGAALKEPLAKSIKADPERLPENREAAAQVLADAGRDQLLLGIEESAANAVEERRSAIIASFCDSGVNLAAGGELSWVDDVPAVGLDVRSIAAFVVKGAQVKDLFPASTTTDDAPRAANFKLRAADPAIEKLPDTVHTVHLFNPPERMYRNRGPRLAEPVLELKAHGVRLDWDLEPAFGRSTGVWNDPEFSLQHYRIERFITDANGLQTILGTTMRTTVKAAGPMRLVRDPVSATFVWRFVRPNAQFVDDLSDLTAQMRAAILPPSGTAADPQVEPAEGTFVLRYTVVPVDTAGTEAPPTPLSITTLPRKAKGPKGLGRAVLHFEYAKEQPIQDIAQQGVINAPTISIGLDDLDDDPKARKVIGPDRIYQLRVRREASIPTGIYGADALTDARARPSAANFAIKQVPDQDFELTFHSRKGSEIPVYDEAQDLVSGNSTTAGYTISSGDWMPFLQAIGVQRPVEERVTNGPIGVRFAIRVKPDGKSSEPQWCPADITLLIDKRTSKDEQTGQLPAIAAPVEVFEHPVRIDAAPLMLEDIDGEAGRVLVLHPDPDGQLEALLGWTPPKNDAERANYDPKRQPVVRLRDGARRVATRVKWNAAPASEDNRFDSIGLPPVDRSARRLARYFGGFDVFEVDAAGEAEGATSAPTAVALRYKRFNSSTSGPPGALALRLDAATQAEATAIFVSATDAAGDNRSRDLDRLNDAEDKIKGQVVLMKDGDAANCLVFDLKMCVRTGNYFKLVVESRDESQPNLFTGATDVPILVFTRDVPAIPVARVQALSPSLARLDPAEIADFAKVEAHYPSETARLIGVASTAGRRAAWYSPAESFLAWPERVPRRSLSINIDEPVLTSLLSSGRPKTIAAELEIADKDGKALTVKLVNLATGDAPFQPTDENWTIARLRDELQHLGWDCDPMLAAFRNDPASFRNARLTISALHDESILASSVLQVDLDPPLHPVLADVIDWVRYEDIPQPAPAFGVIKPSGSDPVREWVQDDLWASGKIAVQKIRVECKITSWNGAVEAANPAPTLGFLQGRDIYFPADHLVVAPGEPWRVEFTVAKPVALPGDDPTRGFLKQISDTIARLVVKLDADQRARLPDTLGAVLTVTVSQPELHLPAVPPASFDIDTGKLKAPTAVNVAGSRYRRYEPVLEPLPKGSAKDVAAWFDDTPEGRDPYGWSILRSVGLAAGLKLYDTELRDYLPPRDTLVKLRDAFKEILPRYSFAALGTPFVDVILHAGGTMSLASFDGGTPALSPGELNDVLGKQALALTQISLRPTIDRFGYRWRDFSVSPIGPAHEPIPKAVAYFAIKSDDGKMPVQIDLAKLQPGTDNVVVADVIDLTTGLSKPPVVTLASKAPASGSATDLRDMLLDGAGDQSSLKIDLKAAQAESVVALVRVVCLDGDAVELFTGSASGGATPWIENATVEEVVAPMTGPSEPFARFADLTERRFGALTSPVGGHPSVLAMVDQLRRYAVRRFPEGWPKDADVAILVARIPEWTRRFFEQGVAKDPGQQPTLRPYFSLAEVTRPDPWRVGVDPDGTMEVLFTHDDRKRRLKRYAIKPFGRYDGYVDALANASDSSWVPAPPRLGGAWSSPAAQSFDAQSTFEESWSRRFFDVVLPRTQPIAPPVLVSAARVDQELGKPGPDSMLEFIFSRHSEEILSEANVTVESALSFEGVSYGFWREFPMQRWADDLQQDSHSRIDTMASFGDMQRRPDVPALTSGIDGFGGLAGQSPHDALPAVPGRYPDGWHGMTALRTRDLPYFFRTHVAAFASAGVVVSTPVVGTIEEGVYDLSVPWKIDALKENVPVWSVSYNPDGTDPELWVTFRIPLVRLFDCMPLSSRAMWLPDSNSIPEVFTLPDPMARYEIRLTTEDAAGLKAGSPEIDVIAEQRNQPEGGATASPSRYRTNVPGPRFDKAQPVKDLPDKMTASQTWWQLEVKARVKPGEASVPLFKPIVAPNTTAGGLTDPLQLFELAPSAFAAGAVWPSVAPTAKVTVTVHSVLNTNPGWPAFKAGVTAWRDLVAQYPSNATVVKITEFLNLWVAYDGSHAPPPPDLECSVDEFAAGLPRLAAGRSAAVSFAQDVSATWSWPLPAKATDAAIDRREQLRAIGSMATFDAHYDAGQFEKGVVTPIRVAMRQLSVALMGAAARFMDYPATSTTLEQKDAEAIRDIAKSMATIKDSAGKLLLPDCADVSVVVTLGNVSPDQATHTHVTALIAALEKFSFAAGAISDLGALEDLSPQQTDTVSALVYLPCRALVDSDVASALTAFDVAPEQPASSLLLWRAPTDGERKLIQAAIQAAMPEPQRAALETFVDGAIAAQIYGGAGKPGIKIYRGAVPPQEFNLARAKGA